MVCDGVGLGFGVADGEVRVGLGFGAGADDVVGCGAGALLVVLGGAEGAPPPLLELAPGVAGLWLPD